jgi:hypothetical protein
MEEMGPPGIHWDPYFGRRGFSFEEGDLSSIREYGSSTDDPYQDQSS